MDYTNDNPAHITMMYLNNALWEVDFLDEENLKIEY
jgi:hypothetical protein